MVATYTKHLAHKFSHWCYIHLVVSVYSFLILSCWGIPFCLMGFAGNLIFGPFIFAFLGLATAIFFTELCCIPNQYIIWLIEKLSDTWIYLLQLCPSHISSIPCPQPSYILISTLALLTFLIMTLHEHPAKKSAYVCCALVAGFWLAGQPQNDSCQALACARGDIHIVHIEQELVVIDPGYLGQYTSAPAFVQYTLVPHIIKQFGKDTIDHLILLQPGTLTFRAVQTLFETVRVKHLYIPYWNGELAKSGLRAFMAVKNLALNQQTKIYRLDDQDIPIIKNKSTDLALRATKTTITRSNITFRAFSVGNIIDNQTVTFYPAKYNIKNKK